MIGFLSVFAQPTQNPLTFPPHSHRPPRGAQRDPGRPGPGNAFPFEKTRATHRPHRMSCSTHAAHITPHARARHARDGQQYFKLLGGTDALGAIMAVCSSPRLLSSRGLSPRDLSSRGPSRTTPLALLSTRNLETRATLKRLRSATRVPADVLLPAHPVDGGIE